MKKPNFPSIARQNGVSLIEALVAVLVTVLGILGILGMQMRTMNNTQAAVRQAQAIRLVENLSERLRMNPNSFSSGTASNYLVGWGADGTAVNCTNGCDSATLAQWDIEQWKKNVREILPLADANVFFVNDESGAAAGNNRQLGVMISWRENESAGVSEDSDFNKYFRLSSQNAAGGSISCPVGRTCYLQFIQLAARCTANSNSGVARPYCADGSVIQIANS